MDLNNKLATRANGGLAEKPKTMIDWINSMKGEIQRALPKHVTADRVARVAITALSNNPKLAQCTPKSFIGGLLIASQLGLEVNTPLGHAYLIPYNNKRDGKYILEAQFQIGYQGIIDLAHRSGQYSAIYAHEVYENDEFDYEYGLHKNLRHKPAMENRGKVIGYYACYHLKSGGSDFIFMSMQDVIDFANKYSQSYQKGYESPWKSDFDSMAKKTVLKQVLKYAPKSIELATQLSQDEAIKSEIAEDMTSVPNQTVFEADYEVVTPQKEELPNEENEASKKEEKKKEKKETPQKEDGFQDEELDEFAKSIKEGEGPDFLK